MQLLVFVCVLHLQYSRQQQRIARFVEVLLLIILFAQFFNVFHLPPFDARIKNRFAFFLLKTAFPCVKIVKTTGVWSMQRPRIEIETKNPLEKSRWCEKSEWIPLRRKRVPQEKSILLEALFMQRFISFFLLKNDTSQKDIAFDNSYPVAQNRTHKWAANIL